MQHVTRPVALLTVLIVVAASILAGCTAIPEVVEREVTPEVVVTIEVEPTPEAQLRWNTEPPRVVDVISTSNETVLVSFSNRMSASAQDVTHYQITRPQLCDVRDWHARLGVTGATLSADGMSVTLTTLSQKGVTYRLVIAGVQDRAGNPLVVPDSGYQATFAGTEPTVMKDSDGDGISDADEQYGWAVRMVLEDGTALCRDVTSDPNAEDTDGDGVEDGEEMGHGTDPRSPDTDGDNLSDYDEIHTYFCKPLVRDTDEDGIPDGAEANLFKTSPAMADTDGDGADDYEETVSGGRNPRLAELPQLSLELYGDPLIEVQCVEKDESVTYSQQFQRDQEEQVDTDTTSTKMSIENTVSLHTELEVGTSRWPPSASAKLTTDTKFHHGYFHDTSSAWTESSIQESQQKYEEWTTKSCNWDNGKLSVAMKVVNQSDLSFKVKDLRVIAYRLENGGTFTLIGAMSPDKSDTTTWPENGFVLGPGGDFVMTVEREQIGAEIMRALVKNPTALLFEVGSYSIFELDEMGVEETTNYAVLGETVRQRTGVIVIDYGNGNVERYTVATNVLRDEEGSGQGVTMREALSEIMGLDYEACKQVGGPGTTPVHTVLCRVKHVREFNCSKEQPADWQEEEQTATVCQELASLGFWTVAGTGTAFETETVGDFDDLRLESGQQVSLVYLQDSDGDGIFDREEYLLGTDKKNVDTDGDGLSDYQESKVGWQVEVVGRTPYHLFSDPLIADLDRDHWPDYTEFVHGTDPFLANTDGDEQDDATDGYPLGPPCKERNEVSGLMAWWTGEVFETEEEGETEVSVTAKDVVGGLEGEMFGDVPNTNLVIDDQDEQVFLFNSGNQDSRYITVQHDDSFSTEQEHTIAARVKWDGVAGGVEQATLLTKGSPDKGANYALYLTAEGKVKYTVHHNYFQKCSACWLFCCGDGCCADHGHDSMTIECVTERTINEKEWVHIAATYGDHFMRVYLNGELACQRPAYEEWQSGWTRHWRVPQTLVENKDALYIGRGPSGASPPWAFRGLMDDIQFFDVALDAETIAILGSSGICPTPEDESSP